MDALKQESQTFATLRSFSMRFRGIFHSRTSAKLEEWIDDAIRSGLCFLARFARFLRRDIDAVCNAIDMPWSNGQAEGQINRLKTIMRAMYGRAGSELIKARMMPMKSVDLHTKCGRPSLNAKPYLLSSSGRKEKLLRQSFAFRNYLV